MPIFRYTIWRLVLFALALALLWWLGMSGWLLVAVAALIAMLVSYLALAGPRDAAARSLADRAARRQARRRAGDEDAAAEDAAAEGAPAQTARPKPSSTPKPSS